MTRPAYPLALILGALSACAVFAAGEAIDRSGHNPFTRPPGDTHDARAPGQSAGGEITR